MDIRKFPGNTLAWQVAEEKLQQKPDLLDNIKKSVSKAITAPSRSLDVAQKKELEQLEMEELRKKLVQFSDITSEEDEEADEEDEEADEEQPDSDAYDSRGEEEGEEIPPLEENPVKEVPPEPFDPDTFCRDAKHAEGTKEFRIKAQRFMLTYKTHLDKTEYKEWLTEHCHRGPFRIEIAHETGDKSHNYLHTHVVMDVGKPPIDSKNCKFFDYKGIHPNIKIIGSKLHWDRSLIYLSKEDPANGHLSKPEEKPCVVDRVWACKSRSEAARLAKTPQELSGILMAYDIKPNERKNPLEKHPLRYWQTQILNRLEEPAHPRKIMWVFDPFGACGKTMLLKALIADRPNDVAFAKQTGGAKDFATVIQSARDSGWNGKIFILDFVRDNEDHKFYEPLEGLKDGLITALKYRGASMSFDSPHVLVFANFLPEVDRLSLDRWEIYEISHDYRWHGAVGPAPQPDGSASTDIAALNINIVRRKREEMKEARKDPLKEIVYATSGSKLAVPAPTGAGPAREIRTEERSRTDG